MLSSIAELEHARLTKERALARLRVLQADQLERRLLPADEVQAIWSAAFARLRDLAMGMPGTVPAGGCFLTAGVDVQADRLELETMTPEQRSERARKAVAAQEAKRQARQAKRSAG
jgi:phage terminase large subunit GpA-like protein